MADQRADPARLRDHPDARPRSRSSPSCTAPSSRAARSCSPRAPSAPSASMPASAPTSCAETARRSAPATGRSRRCRRRCSAGASRSPARSTRKMVINAFNSGADSYMTDFEDSNSPLWTNQIQGQINIGQAIRRTLSFEQETARERRATSSTTRSRRCRCARAAGTSTRSTCTVDGQRVSGGIFDFALFMFHNAKELLARGAGPVLLPAQDGEPPRGAPLERHLRDDAERARACRRARSRRRC